MVARVVGCPFSPEACPMSVAAENLLETELNERLRMETGWEDVGKGLSQILFGYLTLVLGIGIGVGLIVLSVGNMGHQPGRPPGRPSMASLWQLYIGLGVLSVVGLLSYLFILAGQFRCMLGAAERHGARWFMFACITCLLIGPGLNIASGIAGVGIQ